MAAPPISISLPESQPSPPMNRHIHIQFAGLFDDQRRFGVIAGDDHRFRISRFESCQLGLEIGVAFAVGLSRDHFAARAF